MTSDSAHGDQFRLLYFSPNPEDGERVCVAILASVGGMWCVEFDEEFAKLRAIAKDKDVEFVRGVVDMLRKDLDRSDLSSLMLSLEPQFRTSEPRNLLVPWTADIRRKLRGRFLIRGRFHEEKLEREHEERIQARIAAFLDETMPGVGRLAASKLKPDQLFGDALSHQFRVARPVARALVGRTRAVLIDGVDTTLKPSTDVIKKANRIAFTFWQYGRVIKSPSLPPGAPRKIFRVGVVFDGTPSAYMVREYSLHQFQKDADLAIESSSPDGLSKMKEELQSTLQDIKH
jgi:hypothetical protein